MGIKHLIDNGDGLKNHHAVRLEQPTTDLKKRVQIMMAHRFDHFNGNQFVKFTAKMPIIFAKQLDSMGHAGCCNAFFGQIILFIGNGCGGHATSVIFCSMDGKTAPSAADFDDMIFGTKLEFSADSIVFCYRSIFQSTIFVLKDATGIGQCFIQKKPIKIG